MNGRISKKLRKIAAAGVTNMSDPQTSPRRWEWMFENFKWLSEWLLSVETVDDPDLLRPWHEGIKDEHRISVSFLMGRFYEQHTQIFKSPIHCSRLPGPNKGVLCNHVQEILFCAVFGEKFIHTAGNRKARSMSGFVELTGRLPTKDDNAHLVWFPNRRMKYSETSVRPLESPRFYLSECALVIKGEQS